MHARMCGLTGPDRTCASSKSIKYHVLACNCMHQAYVHHAAIVDSHPYSLRPISLYYSLLRNHGIHFSKIVKQLDTFLYPALARRLVICWATHQVVCQPPSLQDEVEPSSTIITSRKNLHADNMYTVQCIKGQKKLVII